MFSFFKKKPPPAPLPVAVPADFASAPSLIGSALVTPLDLEQLARDALDAAAKAPERERWLAKLTTGLRKTGSGISKVFTGETIDEALYENLETALLMADSGVKATEFLRSEVRRKVKDSGVTQPIAVKNILTQALTDLLKPLERSLVIGEFEPTIIMVTGVNGAGKTTSIGKLARHLADSGSSVLLAAGDTFRAAAKEQLAVWADRAGTGQVGAPGALIEIISQSGGDPAAVAFDAVNAARARGKNVVLVDTAGRLPTQLHLMDELKKIKRVVQKAESTGPHEVILVIDGNTGQNALTQVKAFDDCLGLTGLIVTKLDGTAKGGVLAAIALWARDRQVTQPDLRPVPVYFIGVGEKLEDLETFNAREFAQALLA
jgi:fused signal recognition particle receptor